jgi:hypothetical protein
MREIKNPQTGLHLPAWGFTISAKYTSCSAGLLTCGSSYSPRLPTQFFPRAFLRITRQWLIADFVLAHSGGTVPEFHRLPSS